MSAHQFREWAIARPPPPHTGESVAAGGPVEHVTDPLVTGALFSVEARAMQFRASYPPPRLPSTCRRCLPDCATAPNH
jgi:hypothetical protein